MWFIIVVIGLLLISAPKLGIWVFLIYLAFQLFTKKTPPPQQPERQLNTGDLADLVLLRLELKNLSDKKRLAIINKHIDDLCTKYLAEVHAVPNNALWTQRKNSAWSLINRHAKGELGEPPWHSETPKPETNASFTKAAVFIDRFPEPEPEKPKIEIAKPKIEKPKPKPIEPKPKPTPVILKPKEPSALERAFKTLSGWHSLAIPFLIQNIGWFIGVFCFIAGSMFLVAYSSGYTKNLIAFCSFFIFTLALLFGGYQLRKKRPELITSSYVIFILSVLLIPITHINATQLLFNSDGLGLILFSSLLIAVELAVFYFAVQLVSGLINRSLQQQLPVFLIALTASQLLQGLLILIPNWTILALIHGIIFMLLGIAIYSFLTQWLNTLFIDKDYTAYFIIGTLTYTAIIALFSVSRITTPDGYYGVFIMLLCCLLFYIDGQLKNWLTQHTYLSYFSFFLYGLSVSALLVSTQQPFFNILSLILAIGLYGFIVIRYLTLTPLTIFLASIFWLYYLVVLKQLPESAYLLGSIPLLWALQQAANWALKKRQSSYLTLIVYRVLYALLALLSTWSLFLSKADTIAMLNALAATLSIYYALKNAPASLFKLNLKEIINNEPVAQQQNLLATNWFYLIPALCEITVYYAPRFLNDWLQFALGLLLLSTIWTALGIYHYLTAKNSNNVEHYLNSALFSILALILPLLILTMPEQAIILLLASVLIFYISYQLNIRWLFCIVLVTVGIAGALLKFTYYPVPSNGIATLILGIIIWFWLWHTERNTQSQRTILQRELMTQKFLLLPSCYILGDYKLPSRFVLFREVTYRPLEITMLLLAALSLKAIIVYLIGLPLSISIIIALFLATAFSKLIAIRYALIRFFYASIILGMSSIWFLFTYLGCNTNELLFIMALCSLAFWQLTIYEFKLNVVIHLINALNTKFVEQKDLVLNVVHTGFLYITLLMAIIQCYAVNGTSLIALGTWFLTAVFLFLTNKQQENLIIRYLVLIFSLLTLFNGISLNLHSFNLIGFISDAYSGLLLSSSALLLSFLTLNYKPQKFIDTINAYALPATHLSLLLSIFSIILQLGLVLNSNGIIQILDCGVLFLAAISIILVNTSFKNTACATLSIFTLLLSALWLTHSLLHGDIAFYMALSLKTPVDLWWILTLYSGVLASLNKSLKFLKSQSLSDVHNFYALPFYQVSITAFIWSVLGALLLFFNDRSLVVSALLLLQCFISFFLIKSIAICGFITASFLTLSVLNALLIYFVGVELQTAIVLWAYTLYTLPYLLKRYNSVISFSDFSWFGLLLLIFSPVCWQTLDTAVIGFYCLELALYSVLMLRYSNTFAGVSAIAFTVAGFALNFDFDLMLNILLWCNLELLLIRFWQRINYSSALIIAYRYSSDFILLCFLIFGTLTLFGTLDSYVKSDEITGILFFIGLLNLSCVHSLTLFRSPTNINGLIYSALLLFWQLNAVFLHLGFPLFLALCCLPLFMAYHWYAWHYQDDLKKALRYWLQGSASLATLCLFTYSHSELLELLFSVALLIPISIALGFIASSAWLIIGSIEILALLHGWQLLWFKGDFIFSLLPFCALQLFLFRALFVYALNRFCKDEDLLKQGSNYALCLMVLSLFELIAHAVLIRYAVIKGAVIWIMPPFDLIAALGTALMMIGLAIWHLRKQANSLAWYTLSVFIFGVIYYCRLITLGIAPISLWDTTLFIIAAYILFAVQYFYSSKPLLNIAVLMPILALFTVPLQLASPTTSLLLLASGLFYVWVRKDTQHNLPLYLAICAFNASIYLWIPVLADSSQLLQVYVIPAALSVLWLLQLHKHELKPSLLMNTRLAAISVIYACATVDVFLRAELSIFILAIILSMAGILLGISLRIRAFLYAGCAFLILNVLGQLMQFYPEQRLGKAIVLMALGAVIIVSMIWFNIQRVAILERIKAIQSEMETWE